MYKMGDCLKLGIYPSENGAPESVDWIVLQTEENKMKIITKKALIRYKHFYSEDEDAPWRESKIRKYLNNDIWNMLFSDNEKQCILESITVDDEKVIKSFFWDEKNCESYQGVIKCTPVMTRDYITIPSMKDLYDYSVIPDGQKDLREKYEWHLYKLKDECLATDMSWCDDRGFKIRIVYPLLNSIYDGVERNDIMFYKPPKYKRHMVIEDGRFEHDSGSAMLFLRLCIWVDAEKLSTINL